MKKLLIVGLLCINVVLLLALVGVNLSPAQAQTARGGNDYMMVTAKVTQDLDAVWVLDMKTRKLAAWRMDRTTRRLSPYRGRNLITDFGAKP